MTEKSEEQRRKAELAAGFDPDGEVGYCVSIDVKADEADCSITKTVGAHLVPPVEGSEEYSDRFVVKGDLNGDTKKTLAIALLAARDRVAGFHNPSIVD